ncbi:hypothetical protein E5D57_006011 [Metarhizium anisopliae]|nr:hypothetical protein E5D57_006011 [Metarhizium anisopliae]
MADRRWFGAKTEVVVGAGFFSSTENGRSKDAKRAKEAERKLGREKEKKKALTRTDVAVRKVSRSNVGGAKEQKRRQKEEGRENPSPRFIKCSEVMGHV